MCLSEQGVKNMNSCEYGPLSGDLLFKTVFNESAIIMATNTRIAKGVVKGIFKAAKLLDSIVFMELARSESDLEGGYTGLTPEQFSRITKAAAEEVGFRNWALHGDHITVKKGTEEDITATKSLIKAQIEAGYTSFAIDASYLFDHSGHNVREELAKNIEVTTELAKFIENEIGHKNFGLEVEVGEIGKTDDSGMVITTVEEATTFIQALKENDVHPNALAIANGSTHGNIYDKSGKLIEQISIDIDRTVAIAKAIEPYGVRIAQHGITGTPLRLIAARFPKGLVCKGNVGTYWMNIVWEVFEIYEPELYRDIYNWTIDTYRDDAAKKGITADNQIFGTYSKYAIKEFFKRIYNISEETEKVIETRAMYGAMMFFKAFNNIGLGKKIDIQQ